MEKTNFFERKTGENVSILFCRATFIRIVATIIFLIAATGFYKMFHQEPIFAGAVIIAELLLNIGSYESHKRGEKKRSNRLFLVSIIIMVFPIYHVIDMNWPYSFRELLILSNIRYLFSIPDVWTLVMGVLYERVINGWLLKDLITH